MRMSIASFWLLTVWSGAAAAASTAEVIDGLKKMNTDMCIQIGSNVPHAPKDPKLVSPYCACVSEAYWQSVPDAEQQEVISKGSSPGVRRNLNTRMLAAQAACKKQIGF